MRLDCPQVLIDLSEPAWTEATVNKAREVAGAIKKAGVGYGPNAIFGLTRPQKSVADLSMRLAYYADSIEDAKEWLVKQEDMSRKPQSG